MEKSPKEPNDNVVPISPHEDSPVNRAKKNFGRNLSPEQVNHIRDSLPSIDTPLAGDEASPETAIQADIVKFPTKLERERRDLPPYEQASDSRRSLRFSEGKPRFKVVDQPNSEGISSAVPPPREHSPRASYGTPPEEKPTPILLAGERSTQQVHRDNAREVAKKVFPEAISLAGESTPPKVGPNHDETPPDLPPVA